MNPLSKIPGSAPEISQFNVCWLVYRSQQYKRRYPRNTTVTKHSLPEVPKEGGTKSKTDKTNATYDKLNHRRMKQRITAKKVREKSRECHNHKPQPFPDPKKKRKPTNLNKHKPNKRTKRTKISSLFPKRGSRNTKRTEKHKNKMTFESHFEPNSFLDCIVLQSLSRNPRDFLKNL